MTQKQETGMAVIVAVVIIIFLFLSSCGCRKTVTEYKTVHDTSVVVRHDTIERENLAWHHDTIRERVTEYVTIHTRDSGKTDTVRIEIYRDRYHAVMATDSTKSNRVAVDSSSIAKTSTSEKTTDKRMPRAWELLIFAAFCIVTIAAVYRIK